MTAPVTIGDVIAGKYTVEEMVARGGMGIVVAARHRELGQKVAIKLMLRHLFEGPTQVEAEERFLRESRAAVRLRGENIARVFDVGRLDSGTPFIVMEFLEGRDLEAYLKERRALAATEAVDYVMQACVGIAEAHKHGIVHRDLKPANLFLTTRPDGSPLIKVLDFGVSKLYESPGYTGGRQTNAAMVLGSPAYMSPEQVRSPRDVDVRADIWSLGIILYQLVSGTVPFAEPASAAAIFAQILYEEPERLERLAPRVPPGLCERIHRCLKKEPDERYQNVSELAAAFAPFATVSGRAAAASVHAMLGSPGAPGLTPTGTLLLGDNQASASMAPPMAQGMATEIMSPAGTEQGSTAGAQSGEEQDALWAALQNISDTALAPLDFHEGGHEGGPADGKDGQGRESAKSSPRAPSQPAASAAAQEARPDAPAPVVMNRPRLDAQAPEPLRAARAKSPADPLALAGLVELEPGDPPAKLSNKPVAKPAAKIDGFREADLGPLSEADVIPLAMPRQRSRGPEASGTTMYRVPIDALLLARLAMLGAAAAFTVSLLLLGAQDIVVDGANRFLYRTGHSLFAEAPTPWHALGGTLLQLGVPLLGAVLLWWRFDLDFTALACVWWLGEGMVFSSRHIADADAGQLPLIAGELSDWAQVLGDMQMLGRAVELGRTVRLCGSVLMGIALVVMVYLLVLHVRVRR